MDKCWICGRTSEDINKQLGFNVDNSIFKPEFKLLEKEINAFKRPPKEPMPEILFKKYFENVKICAICVILIKCGAYSFFKKE